MESGKLSKKALTEAYEILKLLDDESLEKIPENMLNAIQVNRDKTYAVDITKLVDGDILEETKDILCAVYCEYLATAEEKKVIDEYAESVKAEIEYETEESKVGIPIELFKSEVKEKAYNEITETLPKVVDKKNIITIVMERIKKIFRK